jgi:hypothetical protein
MYIILSSSVAYILIANYYTKIYHRPNKTTVLLGKIYACILLF